MTHLIVAVAVLLVSCTQGPRYAELPMDAEGSAEAVEAEIEAQLDALGTLPVPEILKPRAQNRILVVRGKFDTFQWPMYWNWKVLSEADDTPRFLIPLMVQTYFRVFVKREWKLSRDYVGRTHSAINVSEDLHVIQHSTEPNRGGFVHNIAYPRIIDAVWITGFQPGDVLSIEIRRGAPPRRPQPEPARVTDFVVYSKYQGQKHEHVRRGSLPLGTHRFVLND